MNTALLALEDGSVFEGNAFGAPVDKAGEVVFNTSLTGYQEIFTDPSYAGQIVVLTNPQIGNYGTNDADNEAIRPFFEGLVVREYSPLASNWRSDDEAGDFLSKHGIPGITGIDTRALVRKLRMGGVMRGVLSSTTLDPRVLVERARNVRSMAGLDLATVVSTPKSYQWNETVTGVSESEVLRQPAPASFKVVAYDFGMKRNILRRLAHVGCDLTVVPAGTSAEDVLALKPDGIFLSNGPGDPEPLEFQTKQVQKLIGKAPIFGICLGHQVIGLALGGKTYKLKFGHRGGNHPVLNRTTNKVEITAQNHGFCVDPDSLNQNEVDLTHINLNDQTLEGLRHRNHPLFCVQYHPEAAPGPHDSQYLFDDFIKLMSDWKGSK
ncbi:glutamine-hydrolyzing carbamoyl-phosphate synthase small subunit [Bryobacter aggregatus]|uniref:glutamine-hydrolyzing carbamoyl-phosphate synthase small subunit n=1 Tax=Bryobacter aggregatus TaxID=360054 RepID=UPI0004E0FDC0|nr:glutamine-hydrolyzing carbamoyl-phosphate synthase small subunit [Bryobacter aggregatus]